MPDLSGAPPTIGSSSSSGKFQSQRGGRGRFNPAARGNNNRGGRGGGQGGSQSSSNTNPQHPGHIPGSLSSRPLSGVFAIDKPSGRTSMSLLEDLKILFAFSPLFRNPDGSVPEGYGGKAWQPRENWCKKYKKSTGPPKVGQGGTLDPLASGVLVIGVGSGTKALQEYLDCAKTYTSVGLLGASTTSYDVMDPIMHRVRHSHVTADLITSLLPYFTGPLLQYPPLYSAVKIDGKRLFDYARSNTPLPRPIEAREIEVTELALVDFFKAGEHDWTPPDRELPEEEKALVGRVKELVGQGVGEGDTVVQRAEVDRVREEQLRGGGAAGDEVEMQGVAAGMNDSDVKTQDELAKSVDTQAVPVDSQRKHTALVNSEIVGNAGLHATQNEEQAVNAEEDPSATAQSEVNADEATAPQESTSKSSSAIEGVSTEPTQASTNESHLKSSAFRLRMTVSSGTYVRSIIHDVGLACESASHVVELRRTKQGEWCTADHVSEGEGENEVKNKVIPWSVFDDALKQLKVENAPNAMQVDGKERELRQWERVLLERLRPL